MFAAGSGKAGVHTRDEPCIYANNDYKRVYTLHTEEEKELRNLYYLHEKGHVCNISPDYSGILARGSKGWKEKLQQQGKH